MAGLMYFSWVMYEKIALHPEQSSKVLSMHLIQPKKTSISHNPSINLPISHFATKYASTNQSNIERIHLILPSLKTHYLSSITSRISQYFCSLGLNPPLIQVGNSSPILSGGPWCTVNIRSLATVPSFPFAEPVGSWSFNQPKLKSILL